VTAAVSAPLLEVDGLSVSFNGAPVLDGVALRVEAGELVGLVGPNGAGKSTLLRAITGVISASGSVCIDGVPAASIHRARFFRRVAVVQQLPEAPESMTVESLVLLGRHPHLGLFGRESPRDHEIAAEAMRRAGCARFASRALGTLSGGERRRAFIARALAQEAALLLLDEPTANLDVDAQAEIFDLLQGLARAGAGILVVVHDLTLAATYCDRLVLLSHGVVAATGAPSAVVTEAHVSAVYGAHVQVLAHPHTQRPIVVPRAAGSQGFPRSR
jgi:iron complex transport system ATP-binding protein